jgi:hypothetical protein
MSLQEFASARRRHQRCRRYPEYDLLLHKQARGFRQFLLRGVKGRVGHDLHDPQSPETFHLRKGRLTRLPCNKCPAGCVSGRPLGVRTRRLRCGSVDETLFSADPKG